MDDTKDKKVNPLVQPVKLGSSNKLNAFHKQVAEGAKTAQTQAPPSTSGFADMSSTVIFPDCSGSMSTNVEDGVSKMEFCRRAVNTFIDNCFIGATKIGIASFPELVVVEPTADLGRVKVECQQLDDGGGTPMAEPLDFAIHEWPISHGIVISDGCPDDESSVRETLKKYKMRSVKLDAVHIGHSTEGEAIMKEIAETTGGIYIKFTNVKAFAESFKFLTPQHRLTLTTSKNPTLLLNAAEVKL